MENPQNPQLLHLKISYRNTLYDLDVPRQMTLSELKQEIEKVTKVLPKYQKLLGLLSLPDESCSLSDLKLKDNSKLTVIGSSLDQLLEGSGRPDKSSQKSKKSSTTTSTSSTSTKTNNLKSTEEESKYLSQKKEHSKIISKGLPKDAEKGDSGKDLPWEKTLKGILNMSGNDAKLSLKEDELWVITAEETYKIKYLQVKDIYYEKIIGYEDYSIMMFKLGDDKYFLYFIPAQYCRAIKYKVLGLDFPLINIKV